MKKDKDPQSVSPADATPPPTAAPADSAAEPADPELLQAAAAVNWDKYLRATADLDNYRKRAIREKEEAIRQAREQVIVALLPALDNLERALEHSAPETPLQAGLLQVHTQFKRALAEFGLVEVTVPPGTAFDPNLHEAISHVPSPDQPEGTVLKQLQSGYQLASKLLRPARVAVSKGPASTS